MRQWTDRRELELHVQDQLDRVLVSLSTVTRNRRRAGVKSIGNRRLTEEDVRAIPQSDEPNKVVAARYGVTAPNIHAIRQRKTWGHVE